MLLRTLSHCPLLSQVHALGLHLAELFCGASPSLTLGAKFEVFMSHRRVLGVGKVRYGTVKECD